MNYVKARTLTECVLAPTWTGRLKHFLWLYVLNGRRRTLPSARGQRGQVAQDETVQTLRSAGIASGTAADFLSPEGLGALAAAEAIIRTQLAAQDVQEVLRLGEAQGQHKNYLLQIVDMDKPIRPDHPLLSLALDERLLQTVARYLGMYPLLHAAAAWYHFPVAQEAKASQLWHRDPEDLKTVKVFIYLDDVGPKQGPFSYIPGTQPFGADCLANPTHAHPRRVLDGEMEATLPRAHGLACTGPAHTMLVVDTVGFHRGGNVQEGHRLLVTFTYTSARPQKKRRLQLSDAIVGSLSPIQMLALQA